MKRILLENLPIILLLGLSLLITWPIFLPGYFSHHDDLQVMRIFEMRKCLEDFQIPCRWVPDMGYGNGFPLYNYYNVFPYYLGAIFSFIFGFLISAKLLFLIPLSMAGISMYLLVKEFLGKIPALGAGVLYMFAPYRAVDAYVRGAVAESFALALIPLVFYLILKFIREGSYKYFLATSLTTAFFLTSHNVMTLFFLPLIFLWSGFWSIVEKNKKGKAVFLSLIIGIGISAFFLIPAYFEKNLVETDTLRIRDLDFRGHFVTVNQLFFDRSWGYGASKPGPYDEISLQIGWPYWWLVIVLPLLLLFSFFMRSLLKIMNNLNRSQIYLVAFLILLFIFSLFMMHNKSAFIWESISMLQFAQFPWRFLALSIFSSSIVGGFLIFIMKDKYKLFTLVLICGLSIVFNWFYFRPEKFINVTEEQKLSGELWEEQQKAAILDYLPITAYEPREAAPQSPIIVSGDAQTNNFVKKSNSFKFDVNVKLKSNVEVPIFDFPNWTVYVNGQKFLHSHDNLLGRIRLNLDTGDYKVEGYFKDTPIRTFSNIISLASILLLPFIYFYGKNKFFAK